MLIILHPRAEDSGVRRGSMKKKLKKKNYVRWKEDILSLWGACGTIPFSRPNYGWDLFDFGLITCSYFHLGKPQWWINDGVCRDSRGSWVHTEWSSVPWGAVGGKMPPGYMVSVFNLPLLQLVYLYSYSTRFLLCPMISYIPHLCQYLIGVALMAAGGPWGWHFF